MLDFGSSSEKSTSENDNETRGVAECLSPMEVDFSQSFLGPAPGLGYPRISMPRWNSQIIRFLRHRLCPSNRATGPIPSLPQVSVGKGSYPEHRVPWTEELQSIMTLVGLVWRCIEWSTAAIQVTNRVVRNGIIFCWR